MEITFREVLVSIAITFILIGLGFLIQDKFQNRINETNEKYYKALKINNDEEMFKYAIKTNVGYTLAQGKVQSINSVHIDDIEDTYFKIKKVTEKYTQHFRTVTKTKIEGNKTVEYEEIEEYWTWDYAGETEWHIEKFKFLGVEFDYDTIKFYNETYKETKNVDYYTRYQYYVIPCEFEGTLFTYINNNTINQNTFLINNTIESIMKSKKSEETRANIAFWIIWILFIVIIDFGYMYLENDYLED